MELRDASAIDDVLRTQVGRSARWRVYDRELDSPMNFVLTRAERHLGMPFAVYWVDDAPPDVFCLQGFSMPVAVFSTRYIELWGDLRGALTSDMFGADLRSQLTEQLALRLIAELSLGQNDPEFAASTMLRSTMAGDGLSYEPNSVASLELEPIDTSYMACWFYGLAHELGHFAFPKLERSLTEGIRDEDLFDAIDATLDGWNLPAEVRDEARSNARTNRTGFMLGVDNLRSEGHADIFATSLLFESTLEIMQVAAAGQKDAPRFNIVAFISEMVLSLNIVAMLDRCRRTAIHASTAQPQRQHIVDTILHPIAVSLRLRMVRWYLQVASASYLFGDNPTPEEHRKVSAAIDEAMKHLQPAIEASERGLARAMNISLDRERRGTFFDVLQEWQRTIGVKAGGAAIETIAIERFCELAASMGKTSSIFETMLDAARNPSAPLQAKVDAGTAYFCPWIDGPDDFNRPFGLDTKHGHLIFVFVRDSTRYQQFRNISAEMLASGYSMQSTVVVANTDRQLRDAIALRLPLGYEFRVVVEGSQEFDDYLKELAEDTIWPR
jgi:hypothetical protein